MSNIMFLVSSLLYLSTLATAMPSGLLSRQQQQCRHEPFPENGKLYTLSCNVDRPGGDYAAVQPGTLAYCLNACTSDSPRCVSATWDPSSQFCYLKSTVTEESLVSSNLTTLVIGTGCQNRQRLVGNRQCAVRCGTDMIGANYQQAYYGSFEACVQACGADAQCVTAQYREDTGYCYLKNSTSTSGLRSTNNSLVDSVWFGGNATASS